ncbi:MAG: hypothetical protein U0800_05085 [Isosphaeraceae bacterium]
MFTMRARKVVEKRRPSHRQRRADRHRHRLSVEQMESMVLMSTLAGTTPNYYNGDPNWAYSPQPIQLPDGTLVGGIEKFIDSLPGLTAANANNLGQYIPVAVPDTRTYPGCDYYEIELGQYYERLSSDLNPTLLRGYRQTNTTDPTVSRFSYLGPMIVSQANRPVRIKFTNNLPTGMGGDLFLPVDTTVMGAGAGANMMMPMAVDRSYGTGSDVTVTTMAPHLLDPGQFVEMTGFTPAAYDGRFRVTNVIDSTHFQIRLNADPGGPAILHPNAPGDPLTSMVNEAYTDNRAVPHLHGGNTVWISDGSMDEWITPAGENTSYPKGVSAVNVPDMTDPGPGSMTFYYSNQQSARLMWVHDHAAGITRLNVYAGEAMGYLLTDQVEQDLISRGIVPNLGTPLIIQDKTFIDPTTVYQTDPTWPIAVNPADSDLWSPHVYMINQNPNSPDGTNPTGRWDYGPFFWPPWPTTYAPIHGVSDMTITNPGSGYTRPPIVTITAAEGDTGTNAVALAEIDANGELSKITVTNRGTGYTRAPIVTIRRAPGDNTGLGATATAQAWLFPNFPDVSMTMESYMDTPWSTARRTLHGRATGSLSVSGPERFERPDVEPPALHFQLDCGPNQARVGG